MYIDAIEYNNKIHCWYREPDNKLTYIEDKAPYYLYRVNENNSTHKSMFGNPLSKQTFDDRKSMRDYITKHRNSTLFESDVSPVNKFLSDNFYQVEDTFLNLCVFDIEVDYDLSWDIGYPTPDNPYGEINSFSMYDFRKDEYHMIILKDVEITPREGETLIVHHCVTERQLIDTFVKLIEEIDIISAWNGDRYDIPYIMERCIDLYGENEGLSKLCRGGFKAKYQTKIDDYDNEYIHYTLVGRSHIDYMLLYKKFTFGEKPSYALDNIVSEELNENKLAYVGDLGDMYRTDPQKFYEYSYHDSRLMKLLNDKLQFLELATTMAKKATIKLPEVLGSIKYLEMAIINHCHFDRDDIIILPDKVDSEREKFSGGFVIETKAAGYGWSLSVDLSGLYPSVIRTINISPETFEFALKNRDKDFIKVVEMSNDWITMTHVQSNESIKIKGFELYDMLREEDMTISANGCIFRKEKGIIPEILDLWAQERNDMKALSHKFYKNGDNDKGDFYDREQMVRKLSNNSLYGAISNPYSRFYNIDLAKSVTMTGQEIEKYQIMVADVEIEKRNG